MNPPNHSPALLQRPAESSAFLAETLAGLSKFPKELLCKFFYDDRGAKLFQKICELPEYYVTRTELGILRLNGAEMAQALGLNVELIGLGTGAGTKTKILLEELRDPAVYIPIDISREQLQKSTERFRKIFPKLEILPIAADYLEPFELPLPRRPSSRSIVYFPGSTIGNFDPPAAAKFLRRLADLSGPDSGLLIGVDLQKDPRIIEAAYNDQQGVTAEFNLNLLVRANQELGANFDLNRWRHRAIYNPDEGRIEMYLISQAAQRVRIEDREFEFGAGEKVLTEYSYKHTPEGFGRLAAQAGFRFEKIWTDDARLFGVFYFSVAS
jgi:dimethylhistidine N-methyltransferase